jgi:hypothetical protein
MPLLWFSLDAGFSGHKPCHVWWWCYNRPVQTSELDLCVLVTCIKHHMLSRMPKPSNCDCAIMKAMNIDRLLQFALAQVFMITSPAMYGGSCPGTNGTTRLTQACNNTTPCPPRHCVGSWITAAGACQAPCGGGTGCLLEQYVVTVTAAYNGEYLDQPMGCWIFGSCASSSCSTTSAGWL